MSIGPAAAQLSMLDVITALVSEAMVDGFKLTIKNRDEVHADLLISHAPVRKGLGNVSREDGLSPIKAKPDHRLRHLVAWVDEARFVKMSKADE